MTVGKKGASGRVGRGGLVEGAWRGDREEGERRIVAAGRVGLGIVGPL